VDVFQTVACNLRKRRCELHMTQRELAEQIAYSEKAVSKWETANALPPSSLLPELAKILQISIDALMSSPDDTRYFLGIDGGGTKTEFVLTDEEGRVLGRVIKGPSNPNDIGYEATCDVLREGIFEVVGDYPIGNVCAYAGIAGATTANNTDKMKEFLEKLGLFSVACGSDTHNAVSVALCGRDGVAVIMGTGSVAYAQKNGELFRVGGYGYLIGDSASGFAFGRDAILAALGAEDGSGAPTCLHALVAEKLGDEAVLPHLAEFYRGGKRAVAEYAPLVFQAMQAGDETACRIVERNMDEIAHIMAAAVSRLEATPADVVLLGGMTVDAALFMPILQEKLKALGCGCRLSVCRERMVLGALYLAGLPTHCHLSE